MKQTPLIIAFCLFCCAAWAQNLNVYYANLHSHTDYSDAVHQWFPLLYKESKSPLTAFQHALWPGGLHVLAVTDHAEQLSPYALDNQPAAEVLGITLWLRHQHPNEWGETLNQALSATVPGSFVALRGFEWTGHMTDAAGHINVIGSTDYTGAYGFLPQYQNLLTPSLSALYLWLQEHPQAVDGGTVVCQFNHPNSYSHIAPPFADFRRAPEADQFFTLFEIGSGYKFQVPLLPYRLDYSTPAQNEPWYIRALDNGWHLAPTINEDNHTGLYGNQTSRRTGIWASALNTSEILGALRLRKVFATEDSGLSCLFWAEIGGEKKERYLMGYVGVPAAPEITLKATVTSASKTDISSAEVITVGGKKAWQADQSSLPKPETKTAEWTVRIPYAQVLPEVEVRPVGRLTVLVDASKTWAQGPSRETYYFLKVQQRDGDLLYSAPIWVQSAASWRPKRFSFSFGDGSPDYTESADSAPDGAFDGRVLHTYAHTGRFQGSVSIEGYYGETANAQWQLDIENNPVGDVNRDGKVTVSDAVAVLRCALGLITLSAEETAAADLYPPTGPDGRITIADAVLVLKAAVALW
jgi:hypothetical protein